MHDIKFRAWDNTSREYNYKVLVGNNDSKDKNYTCSLVLFDGDWLHFDEFCGDIEQYTGLKDKNGTEIYEGDVLIDDTGEPIEHWVVKFSDGGFVGECVGVAEPLFELTQLEVVDNAHENPELLEGSNVVL